MLMQQSHINKPKWLTMSQIVAETDINGNSNNGIEQEFYDPGLLVFSDKSFRKLCPSTSALLSLAVHFYYFNDGMTKVRVTCMPNDIAQTH